MRKVVIAMSEFPDFTPMDEDTDYWAMAGLLTDETVEQIRTRGVALTIFDRIDTGNEDDILSTIAMATLHNADWQDLQIMR